MKTTKLTYQALYDQIAAPISDQQLSPSILQPFHPKKKKRKKEIEHLEAAQKIPQDPDI